MSTAGKRAAVTRRRIAAASFTALAGVSFAAPLLISTRAGAATDEPTTTTATELSIPETTTTFATSTTIVSTTTPDSIALPILPIPTTTTPVIAPIVTTSTTDVAVGQQEVVQLGGDQTPVSLEFDTGSAAAVQLPQTGATPTFPTLTGIALLIAGALASSAKRRRNMGMIPIKSRRRS